MKTSNQQFKAKKKEEGYYQIYTVKGYKSIDMCQVHMYVGCTIILCYKVDYTGNQVFVSLQDAFICAWCFVRV